MKTNNKISKFNIGYKQKLIISIAVLTTTTFIFLTTNRINTLKELMYERIINRVNTLGNVLAEEIKDDLVDNEIADLREALEIADKQKRIDFVSVIDNNGKILFSSQNEIEGKINSYVDDNNIDLKKNIFIKSFQLIRKKEGLGRLQIGFSLDELSQDLKSSLNAAIVTAFTGLVIILLGSWIISEKLTGPLKLMSAGTKKYARGDFSERFSVKTKDIIGDLQLSLNDMAAQLDDLNKNMQKKVDEATEKYNITNKDLLDKTVALEKTNKKLRELDILKSDFVSMVSHELRTPLTGIIGFAKTMQKLQLKEEQKEKYLKIIESEGKRLAKIVEDFLDISKIESGKIEMHLKKIDIVELLKDIVDNYDYKNLIVNAADKDLIVRADSDRIRQVIINLLNNAVKYSTNGKRIVLNIEEAENAEIKISVKDEGTGIQKDDLSKIFEKFYRCDDDISRKSRGSGLGLAISKEIIQLHKGKIWAESEYGHGSQFNILLIKA
ncbi:sensor histidine kinase [Elusimicrobiota bacterium]